MSANDTQMIGEMIKDIRIGMLTSVDSSGKLLSRPMSTQDTEFDGDLWFVAERNSDQVRSIQANPVVNVSYAGKGTWVSVAGRAVVVDDEATLRKFWDRSTDFWMEGGPDNPNNVLLRVEADSAEYWGGSDDGAGGRVGQLVQIVKGAVSGGRPEGRNDTVEL